MDTVIPAPQAPTVPVAGGGVFPVRRIYCVGRNYVEHAQEMGFTGREPPFFFMKPADAVVPVNAGETGTMAYPSLTKSLHHEIELVVAIGTGGKNIKAADAHKHFFGYAVGLDMTRRDLQGEMKKQGRPWDIGKGFEQSAPIGPITPRLDGASSTGRRQAIREPTTSSGSPATVWSPICISRKRLAFCRAANADMFRSWETSMWTVTRPPAGSDMLVNVAVSDIESPSAAASGTWLRSQS